MKVDEIKKLCKSSGIDFGNFESVTVDIDQIETLVQLLLHECVDILEIGMDGYDSNESTEHNAGQLAAYRWARRAIKDRFGVK